MISTQHLAFSFATLVVAVIGVESPVLVGYGQAFRVPLDSQVTLPCNVTGLGDSVLVWKQGSRVIFAGQVRVRQDPRFTLEETNLVISYAKAKDSDVYTCQIETKSKKDLMSLSHQLLVESMPVLYSLQRTLQARVGGTLQLKCEAKGSPAPNITWSLQKRDLSSVTHWIDASGSVLTLTDLGRTHSGNYTCTADNGVGPPVSRVTSVDILFGPEVMVERKIVHTSQGCSAQLVCFVTGNPTPEVKWFHHTLVLVSSKDIIIKSTGTRNELTLSNVDLGGKMEKEYSCTATNEISTSTKTIKITGLAESPVMYGGMDYLGNSEYKVHWYHAHATNIHKFRLAYKQVKENESNSVVEFGEKVVEIPVKPGMIENQDCDMSRGQNFSFVLHNLELGAKYQVGVCCMNEYGWSQMSNIIFARTNPEHIAKKVSKSEMIQVSGSQNQATSLLNQTTQLHIKFFCAVLTILYSSLFILY